uniref:NADH-ubiquinone oxidoreductase chain 2 n=1 Tax=Tomicodon cryptus TaxID=2912956 RepID=A0AA51ZSE0_9TELE|nr:NADH dehydrogenase subunit 2 [Tomicodon cryptus]WMY90462.1 NADH dehydrogenase subunit 2 [Tomicodon cryptus]
MNPFILTIFLLTLGLGTTVVFSSSHWALAWMGLEINTMAILPLMARYHHPRSVEATMKYFLTQATAAAMILFASISNAWLTGQWDMTHTAHPAILILLTFALALKLGLAPFHAWLPEVLQGLDLTTALILSTWQKLAPFIILMQIQPTAPAIFILIGLTSILIGGWGGLNQTQIRKILAYSSIAHLGWMILALQFSSLLALFTLIMYMLMTSSIFLILNFNNVKTIASLSISWSKSPVVTCLIPLALLSLGGLPPLSGFAPKWLILKELTMQTLPISATLAALSALLSLYFYLRLCYAATLTMAPHQVTTSILWRVTRWTIVSPLVVFTVSTIMLLPILPALTFFS